MCVLVSTPKSLWLTARQATLVVILPSRQGYTGGALRVQHNTATHRADFAGQSQEPGFAGAFACFFADCRHVVEPVLSGVRVCLTFNLVRTVHDFPVRPPAFRLPVPHFPPDHPMLYHMLEHEYTEANLSFGGLKGHDRTVAETMCARSWSGQNTMAAHFSTELGYPSALAQLIAAYCVEFDVSLCLVKVSVRGCPEGDPDVPEDIKMGAIRRTSTEVGHPSAHASRFLSLPPRAHNICRRCFGSISRRCRHRTRSRCPACNSGRVTSLSPTAASGKETRL